MQKYFFGNGRYTCPKKLRGVVLPFAVSDSCCFYQKKKPYADWLKANNKTVTMTGIRKAEGGQRTTAKCMYVSNKTMHFNPLLPCTDSFIDWYIETRSVRLSAIYYAPYNAARTGCIGCPFNLKLKEDLDKLDANERALSEHIWQPVYAAYRKLRYRLRIRKN